MRKGGNRPVVEVAAGIVAVSTPVVKFNWYWERATVARATGHVKVQRIATILKKKRLPGQKRWGIQEIYKQNKGNNGFAHRRLLPDGTRARPGPRSKPYVRRKAGTHTVNLLRTIDDAG